MNESRIDAILGNLQRTSTPVEGHRTCDTVLRELLKHPMQEDMRATTPRCQAMHFDPEKPIDHGDTCQEHIILYASQVAEALIGNPGGTLDALARMERLSIEESVRNDQPKGKNNQPGRVLWTTKDGFHENSVHACIGPINLANMGPLNRLSAEEIRRVEELLRGVGARLPNRLDLHRYKRLMKGKSLIGPAIWGASMWFLDEDKAGTLTTGGIDRDGRRRQDDDPPEVFTLPATDETKASAVFLVELPIRTQDNFDYFSCVC